MHGSDRRPRTPEPPTTAVRLGALAVALTALAATALVGCEPAPPGAPGAAVAAVQPPPAADPADQPALWAFYRQKPTWTACGDLQCATLSVPMDYARPQDGRTFTLPLIRAVATDPARRTGSLVFNPGGPGGSGVQHLSSGGLDSFGTAARAHFDIVGFDPRGVAGSRPAVDCTGPDDAPDQGQGTADAPAVPLYPRTDAERRAALADADRSTAACASRSGPILPHVGTLDAARDLDVLRAALGDERLTYLGWSYGTYLGTVYAEQFPRRVRALVLDGAVDPSLDWRQRILSQGRGFRKAVDDYAENCSVVVKKACPEATPDGIRRLVEELYAKAAGHALRVKGGSEPLDESVLLAAVTLSMYSPESQWQELSEALTAARAGDGAKLAAIAGQDAPAEDGGTDGAGDVVAAGGAGEPAGEQPRDNGADVLSAVNCLDVPHPTDPRAYWDLLDEAYRDSGVYGASVVLADLGCRTWPAGSQQPHRVSAEGLPPVLVVGTTGDAPTPYAEAQSLAAQLPGGMLLTNRGLGHTAYGRGNQCVTDAVDGYLVDLRPVPAGTAC
ncbi:alpha/beta hydrolase [Kitasatospora sp. NPDC048538]|uniref:alpha/beta hydrolase n=1 Tax=unclassified Kitasatospora TaxID=2633591 RepID=UPI00341025D5